MAEFCEETGYHNRLAHLEGFESRKKRSRKLDLTLYFTENSIPGLVDPVPDEVRFGSLCAHFSHVKLNFWSFPSLLTHLKTEFS